jgi:hypothetical protein
LAYQRFGEDSDLYIWASTDALNVWIVNSHPTTKTVKATDGLTELKFDGNNLDEAIILFQALYDHLCSNDAIVEINKKRKELKIRKVKKNG